MVFSTNFYKIAKKTLKRKGGKLTLMEKKLLYEKVMKRRIFGNIILCISIGFIGIFGIIILLASIFSVN